MSALSLQPTPFALALRRLCFASLVAATVAVISWRSFAMLQLNGLSPLKLAIFALFVILLLPIALSFWTAVLGFLVQWRGGDELELSQSIESPPAPDELWPRTAIVMPVYNEEPVRVFAGLKAMYDNLAHTGLLSHFNWFVLSDTTNPDLWVREEIAFAELRQQVADPERLHYRNRRENLDRKAGNIADFCATWGEDYEYMIVLDADSVMTGPSLVNLVRLMEKHPQIGILQAPPLPVNRQTLFGRLHQFAMHAFSLSFITGLNFWQGGDGNYWGHNAIVRIRPFMEHCRLPKLSGKEPLGGPILSHDFVEAAFMRRAGWLVYLASGLRGSYEELPGSLLSYAARDRRWCQGNLQHARLLFTRGFHLVTRIHIWMGIMAYVAPALWLLLLALTTAQGIIEHVVKHPYFPKTRSLFPVWPISVQQQAIMLFALMIALLLVPKLLSFMLRLPSRARRARFGGGLRFGGSMLAEMLGSTLLAPNLALLQTRFVIGILLGRNVKWEAQDRGDAQTTFREAFRRHWPSPALGLGWSVLLALTVPKLLLWFSPVIAGLLLAVPLSAWSSKSSLGTWARRRGLFLIPEELAPPEVLQGLHAELESMPHRCWAFSRNGLAWVLEDARICTVHLSLLSPPHPDSPLHKHYLEGLELKLSLEGAQALTSQEQRQLLLHPDSIRRLQKKGVPEPEPVLNA